ncbi:hypothetical protein GWR56_13180 [Mucilaginibacter sp. 14171R-50]|uniref:hypothetical protein n=1 Tax=Mucilaginibacter sp. 14171R-50 TaxID=2703789 RepID=UPI00138D415D|nr:hypothetical protein [Mucilaginibacter sp. 14171R-50]QHS56443.1 hypothetical protein GWR56_13180 [Mucilaginibacter sp. 14171R-50]
MKVNCNIFFELMTRHAYYESGWCECFSFSADEDTARLFKRYQIGIAAVAGGFKLYTFGRGLTNLVDSLNAAGPGFFQININCSDPTFYNFTELPTNWIGSIEYNTAYTSAATANAAELYAKLLPDAQPGYAGKIIINFNDLTSLNGRPAFYIEFSPRATQWQYYVINQSAVYLSSPVIEDKQHQTSFEGPQQVTTVMGQPALFFSSGQRLLPLSNWPKYKFNLLDRLPPKSQGTAAFATTAKMVFKGLPNPDPGYVSPVLVNNRQQLSSPMYVYL